MALGSNWAEVTFRYIWLKKVLKQQLHNKIFVSFYIKLNLLDSNIQKSVLTLVSAKLTTTWERKHEICVLSHYRCWRFPLNGRFTLNISSSNYLWWVRKLSSLAGKIWVNLRSHCLSKWMIRKSSHIWTTLTEMCFKRWKLCSSNSNLFEFVNLKFKLILNTNK